MLRFLGILQLWADTSLLTREPPQEARRAARLGMVTLPKGGKRERGRHRRKERRDAITQRPQPPDLGLLGDLRTMVESLLGGDSVSFCTYPDTAHVPITCFCLLNAAVLRAPKEPELQLLPRHVTIRGARGSDSGLLWCLAYGLSWHLATKTASPAEH